MYVRDPEGPPGDDPSANWSAAPHAEQQPREDPPGCPRPGAPSPSPPRPVHERPGPGDGCAMAPRRGGRGPPPPGRPAGSSRHRGNRPGTTADAPRPPSAHGTAPWGAERSEEHTSELQSRFDLVCRLLLEKKKNIR